MSDVPELFYPKITAGWRQFNGEMQVTMTYASISQVRERAIQFGYVPPKWYKPWQYFTGGLWIVTVGFGV